MDCKQALMKLYNYLDNELSPEDYSEVEAHLKTCKKCFAKAQYERIIQEVVRKRCQTDPVPISLKTEIIARIRQLDNISQKNSSDNNRNFFFRP